MQLFTRITTNKLTFRERCILVLQQLVCVISSIAKLCLIFKIAKYRHIIKYMGSVKKEVNRFQSLSSVYFVEGYIQIFILKFEWRHFYCLFVIILTNSEINIKQFVYNDWHKYTHVYMIFNRTSCTTYTCVHTHRNAKHHTLPLEVSDIRFKK